MPKMLLDYGLIICRSSPFIFVNVILPTLNFVKIDYSFKNNQAQNLYVTYFRWIRDNLVLLVE